MSPLATFDDVVSSHRPYLLRFASRRLGDAALAEDVVQETLLAALQGIERFARKAALRTWLTGILINKIADSARRDRRGPSSGGDFEAMRDDENVGVAFDADGDAHDEPIEWRDPARLLESRQIIELLRGRLEAMPPLAARAFALREIDGLSLDEIAGELGITASHSAVLVHRARRRLREGLERQLGSH